MRPNGEPAWKIPDGAGYLVWELCDEEEKEEDDKEDDKDDDDDDDDAIIQRSATLRAQKMCQSESHVSQFWYLFSYV